MGHQNECCRPAREATGARGAVSAKLGLRAREGGRARRRPKGCGRDVVVGAAADVVVVVAAAAACLSSHVRCATGALGAGNDMPIAVRARAAREEKLERERYSACT